MYELDRQFFIPFMRAVAPACGTVAVTLNIFHLWLLAKHSPMFDKDYRNSLIASHVFLCLFDIIFLFVFVPYPLFPYPILLCNSRFCSNGISARILAVAATVPICGNTFMIMTLFFLRQQLLLPVTSVLRMSGRTRIFVLGAYACSIFLNLITLIFYGGDHPDKGQILEDPNVSWIKDEVPGALVWGDRKRMGGLVPFLHYMMICLAFSSALLIYLLIGSAHVIVMRHREAKSIKKNRKRDNAVRLVIAQMIGSLIFFLSPLIAFVVFLRFETIIPEDVKSFLRIIFMMLFNLNSLRTSLINLSMNTHYRRYITSIFCNLNGYPLPRISLITMRSMEIRPHS